MLEGGSVFDEMKPSDVGVIIMALIMVIERLIILLQRHRGQTNKVRQRPEDFSVEWDLHVVSGIPKILEILERNESKINGLAEKVPSILAEVNAIRREQRNRERDDDNGPTRLRSPRRT